MNIHIVVNTPAPVAAPQPPQPVYRPQPICPNHNGEGTYPPVFNKCVKCKRGLCYYCLMNYKGSNKEFICTPCRTGSR